MKLNKQTNKNPSGFVIPKDYFDSFEVRLLQNISENKTFLQVNPANTSGFEVPKAYFDTVEKSILDQNIPQKNGRVISLWHQKMAKVAAVLLILITGYSVFQVSTKTSQNAESFSNISDYDLELYIENNILPYSEMRNLFVLENDFDIAESNINELNRDVILQYLDNELDDLELLDK